MTGLTCTSLISVDIGTQHTRAWLFEAAEGIFRFTAGCKVPSTFAGGGDVQEGVWSALERLQVLSQRRLLDSEGHIIIHSQTHDVGVEQFVVSLSAGTLIKTALIGLADEASVSSVRRLASMFYTQESAVLSLKDGLDTAHQLEVLMRANPDLIILAGGSDGGACQPVMEVAENIRLAYNLLPRVHKPQIVYAGNSALTEKIAHCLNAGENLHTAGNIQPETGHEVLEVAWGAMLKAFEKIRFQQMPGLEELLQRTDGRLLPGAYALGRMVKFLNRINQNNKGVMALDVGAGSTTVAAAKDGKLTSSVSQAVKSDALYEEVSKWSALPVDPQTTAVYINNKNLHPASMPATLEDLAIEQAWTRIKLKYALRQTAQRYPEFEFHPDGGLSGVYEPIILSGAALINAPTLGQTLLIALDALQPYGITTIVLDHDQLLPALGAAAAIDPLLSVQILDSNIFLNVGTVITVDSPAPEGSSVLMVEIRCGGDPVEECEIHQGSLKRFDVKLGSQASLHLSPTAETDVGMGRKGLGGWVSINGSALGVVIDARGRPMKLPMAAEKRSEMIKGWLWELGG
ncbi:MAG: glutamate mutase L [Chloroflexota bacterium]